MQCSPLLTQAKAIGDVGPVSLFDTRSTDVALRSGRVKSSQLVARKLGAVRMMIVGLPRYFARHGVPRTPDERESACPFSRGETESG